MIHSGTRSLLTDALTPPPGFLFDNGVATTYSLDLVTLLGLPLHLAWLGHAQENSGEFDLVAVMEALRRTAGQLTIFCQRGRMQAPRTASPLYGLLEGMVHEVTASHGGAFHPKVWLLRFTSEIDVPRLRLLVLSRNLTDDRSWDLSLSLEGTIGGKKLQANKPLCALLERTMKMSHKPLSRARRSNAESLVADVMRCEWDLPPGFNELRFHALGVGDKAKAWLPLPADGCWDTLGVISPFVRTEALRRLAESCKEAPFLITRAEELDALPVDAAEKFAAVWVMDERAEASDTEEAVVGRERGLHAKAYVGKRAWQTHLFVGSANASDAALVAGKNVEFMVELIGKASRVGKPGDWLSEDGIGPLLTEYVRSEPGDTATDRKQKQQLEDMRERLCSAQLSLRCKAVDGGWSVGLAGLDQFDLRDVKGWTWPVTVRSEAAVPIRCDEALLHLGVFSAQDITAFTGFRLALGKHELWFAQALHLLGAPADREGEMLRAALRNNDGFVRYLLLLLGDWEPGSGIGGGGKRGSGGARADGLPLFEMMARAYARDPGRLAHVSQVVARLRKESTAPDDEILSADFLKIWRCFEEALNEQGSE
ncbi:phospholipase D family protein [Massilia horti]|uniref:PLD phosphodiesterase domain-containing protein n=1 Tax=Massilia horti TaxID=2562153 RepID=A0A4Y9T4S4_9BURK|nr:phospholipase D family protein [Massilia horti]TFW32911.1 hypothetical protein E4O92_08275 [Massilia horti]